MLTYKPMAGSCLFSRRQKVYVSSAVEMKGGGVKLV